MSSQRRSIPTAELEAALKDHPRAFLFTLRADGSPTIHPMTTQGRDGRVAFSTYRKSAKARNVERDPRAAVLLLRGYHAWPGPGLVVRGRAQLSSDQGGRRERPSVSPAARGVSATMSDRVQERVASGKRVLLVVEGERVEHLDTGLGT